MTPDEKYLERVAELDGGILHEIREERIRQHAEEGWTPEHDDQHGAGELARGAACYAMTRIIDDGWLLKQLWPWDLRWWKPKSRRQDLIRAASLLVAEIERLDRAGSRQ